MSFLLGSQEVVDSKVDVVHFSAAILLEQRFFCVCLVFGFSWANSSAIAFNPRNGYAESFLDIYDDIDIGDTDIIYLFEIFL